MNIEKVSVVYFSATGTTKNVVLSIAKGTGMPQEVYDLTHLSSLPKIPAFTERDLVIIGTPVYFGRVLNVLYPILNTLVAQNTFCVVVGVYGNRHYDDYLVEAEDILRGRGFLPVAGAAFIGEHSFSPKIAAGRPDAEDLKQAEAFGAAVIGKLRAGQEPVLPVGVIAGKRPYRTHPANAGKKEPFGPQFQDNCNKCGLCVAQCPTGAIEQIGVIDNTKCIRCCACTKSCPHTAIVFTNEQFLASVHRLEELLLQHNAPELFI